MAKRKKSKENKNKTYSVELVGLILMLISIIGFGFGYVGNLIKMFAMFLCGTYYIILILFVLLIGAYMLFKRNTPKFFNNKLIGFYIIVLVILTCAHFGYLDNINNVKEIIKNYFDNYLDAMNTIKVSSSVTEFTTPNIGGGIIGALFLSLCYFLFDYTGTIIVLVVLAIFGCVMLFDITIADILDKIKNLFKRVKKEPKNNYEEYRVTEIDVANEEVKQEAHDDKVIITSIDEVKNKQLKQDSLEVMKKEELEVENSAYRLPRFDILNPIKQEKKINRDVKAKEEQDEKNEQLKKEKYEKMLKEIEEDRKLYLQRLKETKEKIKQDEKNQVEQWRKEIKEMEQIMNYVKPELIVVAVALYFLGMALKQAQAVKDKYIPLILGGVSIVLCAVWVLATSEIGTGQQAAMAVFTAITQGILVAGLSNYVNQIIKQAQKSE